MTYKKWNQLKWKEIQITVSNLQRRIYKASKENDIKKVYLIQKFLLNSESAKLLAIRKVTQDNRGKKTPGVDFISNILPDKRFQLLEYLKLDGKSDYIRRVYIPKANGEKRPLGIPTIKDRAKQALVLLALEPEWEAKFEPNSYGFRPGRSCHDAIEAIFKAINRKSKYVLDGDIRKCFDSINHEYLLNKLNTFPIIHEQIKSWLKAGIMEGDTLFPSEQGTPQGGVLSPLLANIALHGIENMLKEYVANRPDPKITRKLVRQQQLCVIRYADDFLVLHPDKKVIFECMSLLNSMFKEIGLEINQEKTKIIKALDLNNRVSSLKKLQFEFLGFSIIQRYIGRFKVKNKLYLPFVTHVSPSKKSIDKHKMSLKEIMRKHRKIEILIPLMNSIIRGWSQYFSIGVSSKIFNSLDHWMFKQLFKWACKYHPTRGKKWIAENYFFQNKKKQWIFGKYIKNVSYHQIFHRNININRHIKIKGNKSPYDGDWIYWVLRYSGFNKNVIPTNIKFLLKKQKGLCAKCNLYFFPSDSMQIDHIIPKKKGGYNNFNNLQLLHTHCHHIKTREDLLK